MLRDHAPKPRSRSSAPSYPRIGAALLALSLAACGDDPIGGDPGGDVAGPFGGSAGAAGSQTGGSAGVAGSQSGGSAGVAGAAGQAGGGEGGMLGGAAPAPWREDGETCTYSDECLSWNCLLPQGTDFAGAGPANGMCSRDCTEYLLGNLSESPCSPSSTCVSVSSDPAKPQAWCLARCAPGSSDSTKCFGRLDIACVPQSSGGVCMPVCATDNDCSPGVCDPASGLCLPQGTVLSGAPDGSACDPSADPDTCVGVCRPNTPTEGTCTRPCVVGRLDACGGNPDKCSGSMPDAAQGDLGVCSPL